MKPGTPCVDRRDRYRLAVFNSFTRCGKFAVVRYRGEHARLIAVEHLATARMLRKKVSV